MKRLLLLSNGTVAPGGYLQYALPWIKTHFAASQESQTTLLFIPHARNDWVAYTQKASEALEALHIRVISSHTAQNPIDLLDKVDGVFIAGGNTFRLLDYLQQTGLSAAIKRRAEKGMPFMGASAGTGVATPSIKTTNDMPIVEPVSFDAMNLVPFQINPHYVDGKFFYIEESNMVPYNGETRADRIREFHERNTAPVVGLPEGTALRVIGTNVELLGNKVAKLFRQGLDPLEIRNGEELSALMA